MRTKRLHGCLWFFLCLSVGCGQPSAGGQRVVVELDVFSGRPNPRWELDDQASAELRQLQTRLTSTPDAPPEPPGLGYRGFLYSDSRGGVRAYRGFVRTAAAVLADPTFSVERFLLDELPAEYAGVRDVVTKELPP